LPEGSEVGLTSIFGEGEIDLKHVPRSLSCVNKYRYQDKMESNPNGQIIWRYITMILKYCKYLLLICIFLNALYSTAESKIEEATKKAFFLTQPNFSSGELKYYSRMLDDSKAISVKNYEGVIVSFYWWLERVLKNQFVPSKSFVKKHIKLIPARRGNTKEDLAFLSYKIQDKTFMIVQSGGMNSRIMIFFNDPSKKRLANSEQGHIRAQSFIKEYCSEKLHFYIPDFVSTHKTLEGYIATGKSNFPIKNIKYAWCYMNGSDMCLYVKKIFLVNGVPPRVPPPNKWFSRLKEEKKPKK
jgi:hypothetical protein